MQILYLGDIMAEPGLRLIERELPGLRSELGVDLVIAQAENLSEGKGILPFDLRRAFASGIDACTGGNHSIYRKDIYGQLEDPHVPVVRPANYPANTPGLGYKYISVAKGKVLIISLLGQIVGKDADRPMDNPLKVIDAILEREKKVSRAATIVNFHGDFSSEKRIIGYYLDGRVSAVIGDHWHTQTNDAEVLPQGTAHITDVGMCGSLDSSLGVAFGSLIPRWRDGHQTRNVMEEQGRLQLNALLVKIDPATGLALKATAIRRIYTS